MNYKLNAESLYKNKLFIILLFKKLILLINIFFI